MKVYSFEPFNEEPNRVDMAVHISGESPAHWVFEDRGTEGVQAREGKPLNEKKVNGFVPPKILKQAKKMAIERMIKERNPSLI